MDPSGPVRMIVPTVSDHHEFAPVTAMKPGHWARYRITHSSTETEVLLGVVAHEGQNVWLEVTEEGNPRRVSLRLISPDDQILEARYREIPAAGVPSVIERQPLSRGEGPSTTPSSPPREVTTEACTIPIGERTVQATRELRLFRDDELGREYREEYLWSPIVPGLFAISDHGGLVREESPHRRVQLVDWGDGYTPLMGSQY